MRQLPTHVVNKVWGRQILPEPFVNPGEEPLGEIWFDPPPELPNLLVKFIFTDATLSVQVHPNDEQAPAGERGKNECWYILDAEPGAQLAIGLMREMSVEELRAAALDGTIKESLRYVDVEPGDFFSIPAGTIHAIGAGISLLEVQQNSDVTYRLYDYDRPRELHLDDGLRVAKLGGDCSALHSRGADAGYAELIRGPFFRVAQLAGQSRVPPDNFLRHTLILPIADGATLDGQPLEVATCILNYGVSGLEVGGEARVILVEDMSAV
ncbi:class I mannose-6-phosphate isomerase [Citromicrobium bathyomarinum]|uniref:class I mannose-6-phosphate isomerase n=1 Tax=Citromicrobium bathyomarinum TaxID=72174 RepID=UPI003159B0C1